VRIAAYAGYAAVDPFVGLVDVPGLPMIPLKAGDSDTEMLADELALSGVTFNMADGFILGPDTNLEDAARAIDLVAKLGARSINAIIFDSDLPRGIGALAALDEWAAAAGLAVLLEFMAISSIPTLEAAREAIESVGSGNIRLMVDALHLSYSGAGPEELRDFLPLIGGAQLCDAPARLSRSAYERMAIEERLMPGEGDLPLEQFMAALPTDMMCAIEIPRRDGSAFISRARTALEAGRARDKA
jgi:sugar phosphate isomerase/epimerase